MPRGPATAQQTTNAAAIRTLHPFPSIEPGRTHMGRTVRLGFGTGHEAPNQPISGGEGTGRWHGSGSSQEGGDAGRFAACRGGQQAGEFQDGSQVWLRSVRHKHISERISNQISRAEFLGVSGPRLMEQVARFRFLFGSSVLYRSSSTQLCPNCTSGTSPVVLTDQSCKATRAPPPGFQVLTPACSVRF